jgi:hypothetical protein
MLFLPPDKFTVSKKVKTEQYLLLNSYHYCNYHIVTLLTVTVHLTWPSSAVVQNIIPLILCSEGMCSAIIHCPQFSIARWKIGSRHDAYKYMLPEFIYWKQSFCQTCLVSTVLSVNSRTDVLKYRRMHRDCDSNWQWHWRWPKQLISEWWLCVTVK